MNKYDFIKELLEDKRTTKTHRDKIIALAAKEFDSASKLEEKIDLVLRKLDAKLNATDKEVYKEHCPKEMIRQLYMFSMDERLKWFTHRTDIENEHIDYIKLINDFKNVINLDDKYLNKSTISFLEDFILEKFSNSDTPKKKIHFKWPKYQASYGYSQPEIYNRLKKGENPFSIILDDISFEDIINRFKHAIQFRTDKEDLKFEILMKEFISEILIININEVYTDEFDRISASLETFIDNNNFFRGLEIILGWINSNNKRSSSLEVDLKEEETYFLLTFYHQGSYINKTPNYVKILGQSGDWSRLRKLWFSIVDWKMLADFKYNGINEAYEITCLDDEIKLYKSEKSNNKSSHISIDRNKILKLDNQTIGGVKHIIKIYKTVEL